MAFTQLQIVTLLLRVIISVFCALAGIIVFAIMKRMRVKLTVPTILIINLLAIDLLQSFTNASDVVFLARGEVQRESLLCSTGGILRTAVNATSATWDFLLGLYTYLNLVHE